MYWQFNDLWQAPTWSTIEYHKEAGKWKMAHYYAQNAYAPLLISPVINKTTSTIDFFALSDLFTNTQGRFELKIYSYDSLEPRLSRWIDFSVQPSTSAIIESIDINDIEKSTGCRLQYAQSCLLVIDGGSNFMLFNNRLADVTNLQPAKLSIDSIEAAGTGLFAIRLVTDRVALFVWLDLTTTSFHGIFSQNGFHMLAQNQTVIFQTDCAHVDVPTLKLYLTVHTLANAYF